MAIPVLAGLPWLASLLGGLFVAVVGFFAEHVTKRIAVVIAVVVALSALTLAFFAGIVAIISGIASVSPPQLNMAMGLIYPDNFNLIISAVFAARLARWAYEWNVKVLQMRLF